MGGEARGSELQRLPAALRGLLHAGAYPHPVAAIELLETQLSWILITGERTYKLKRPIQYPFVDQRRLADRQRLCLEELRLNRRFTPQLYLDVQPVTVVMAPRASAAAAYRSNMRSSCDPSIAGNNWTSW